MEEQIEVICRHCTKFSRDTKPKIHRVFIDEKINKTVKVCSVCGMVSENENAIT